MAMNLRKRIGKKISDVDKAQIACTAAQLGNAGIRRGMPVGIAGMAEAKPVQHDWIKLA
jgi:hypothetical protein